MHPLDRRKCKVRKGYVFRAGHRSYELEGKLGDGAVGLVRRARDLRSSRVVAVKFFAPDAKYLDPQSFDEVAQRFSREGIRGAGLDHPNLVKIIAYEENKDGECFERGHVSNPFIVMEFVRGRTLESLIGRLGYEGRPHVTQQTLHIAIRVSRALRYLHERRVIHRDVKPANVFLSSSAVNSLPAVVKLGDFGVTKWGNFLAAAATGTLTVTFQEGLGTLKYMSPEQAIRPRDVTVRSDIFSLGVTLFELFRGEILTSPHHIFEVMTARRSRGSVAGKLYNLGLNCRAGEEAVFEPVLDCFLMAPKDRPSSSKMRGNIEFFYERAFGEES